MTDSGRYPASVVETESRRLFSFLSRVGWNERECRNIAPKTLRIRELAASRNAVILGHSYVLPEVVFGVADHQGDSLGLSRIARDTPADVIVFCGVRFMGETAKVLSPGKTVLLPSPAAGCSLSESIGPDDVKALRMKYPDAGFVCYVNTSAAVKAECDACCTSANSLAVVEAMPNGRIVFLPDRNMAENLRGMTRKEIIGFDGTCIVHDRIDADRVNALKQSAGPSCCVMVHTESRPEVVGIADVAGGTGDMIDAVKSGKWSSFVVVTEDGMADRFRIEFPQYTFIPVGSVCPHMKMIGLDDVLSVLESPAPDQVVEIDESVRTRAAQCIERMFEYGAAGASADKPHSGGGYST